jgi:ribosome-associated protein
MTRFIQILPSVRIPWSELRFRTSRSGGPGGQNVNKLETRVELLFDVVRSPSLTDEQKDVISRELKTRMDAEGILHVTSQRSRSQWENRQLATARFEELLRGALKPRKKRVATRASQSSRERRLESKKKQGLKKKIRRMTHSDE